MPQETIPKQNRVNPFSQLIRTSARGTLMGNRGVLHNEHQEIKPSIINQKFINNSQKYWIICVLDFNEKKREIMAPNKYTELFFLDEATALSAGHRPCYMCQRYRYQLFLNTWEKSNSDLILSGINNADKFKVKDLDIILHQERCAIINNIPDQQTFCQNIKNLPDGVFVTDETQAYLVFKNNLLQWNDFGYTKVDKQINYSLRILTPPSIIRTIQGGYEVNIHDSAKKLI